MKFFSAFLSAKCFEPLVWEESLVEKLKQLGSDIGQAIGAAVGAPQPVPIPVKVEK